MELEVLRKEGTGVFCSAPGQVLAEDTSGSSPFCPCTEGQSLKCSNLFIFVCKYSWYSLAMYSAHFTYPCTALWGNNFGGEEK